MVAPAPPGTVTSRWSVGRGTLGLVGVGGRIGQAMGEGSSQSDIDSSDDGVSSSPNLKNTLT